MNKERQEIRCEIRYGIKLGDLNDETFDQVLHLYHQSAGVYRSDVDIPAYLRIKRHYPPDQSIAAEVRQTLGRNRYWEWRFGSRLTDHAKLVIRDAERRSTDDQMLIRFLFDPNIVEGDEADKIRDSFKDAVDDFLIKRGIAVSLGN